MPVRIVIGCEVTGAGLILSSLSKHANHSNNPGLCDAELISVRYLSILLVWPMVTEASGGYNKTGLVLAFLALYEIATRPSLMCKLEEQSAKKASIVPVSTNTDESWLAPAIALGGLMFGLHSLLSDSSTLIAWSWTGYKNGRANGPVPNLHGSLTHIAQAIGLFIPVALASHSPTLANPLWFAFGAASMFVTHKYKNWLGYIGGLSLALFLMSIIPLVLQSAVRGGRVGTLYFTAWLVYCLLSLASVWTVAYAFVPGGIYLRERTDW
jgi:hypothetical protein